MQPSVYVDVASMGACLPMPRAAAEQLAAGCARPLIFALTQPGVLSPADAYEWTNGQCIFADRELVRGPGSRVLWPRVNGGMAEVIGLCGQVWAGPRRLRDVIG